MGRALLHRERRPAQRALVPEEWPSSNRRSPLHHRLANSTSCGSHALDRKPERSSIRGQEPVTPLGRKPWRRRRSVTPGPARSSPPCDQKGARGSPSTTRFGTYLNQLANPRRLLRRPLFLRSTSRGSVERHIDVAPANRAATIDRDFIPQMPRFHQCTRLGRTPRLHSGHNRCTQLCPRRRRPVFFRARA